MYRNRLPNIVCGFAKYEATSPVEITMDLSVRRLDEGMMGIGGGWGVDGPASRARFSLAARSGKRRGNSFFIQSSCLYYVMSVP